MSLDLVGAAGDGGRLLTSSIGAIEPRARVALSQVLPDVFSICEEGKGQNHQNVLLLPGNLPSFTAFTSATFSSDNEKISINRD
jgi:hypothetical protein